jgi:hypothetical protein
MNTLKRWLYAFRNLGRYAESLNRRAEVETFLLDAARGKREPPTREECAMLAKKLGKP